MRSARTRLLSQYCAVGDEKRRSILKREKKVRDTSGVEASMPGRASTAARAAETYGGCVTRSTMAMAGKNCTASDWKSAMHRDICAEREGGKGDELG